MLRDIIRIYLSRKGFLCLEQRFRDIKRRLIDPRSPEGRRAIARFHSDNEITMRSAAPRWYRKFFDRRLRTFNDKQLRRWLADPGYDPVMQAWHRHCANWSWW